MSEFEIVSESELQSIEGGGLWVIGGIFLGALVVGYVLTKGGCV